MKLALLTLIFSSQLMAFNCFLNDGSDLWVRQSGEDFVMTLSRDSSTPLNFYVNKSNLLFMGYETITQKIDLLKQHKINLGTNVSRIFYYFAPNLRFEVLEVENKSGKDQYLLVDKKSKRARICKAY